MGLEIVMLVLASALMHPIWNLIIKKNPDPQLGYLCLTLVLSLCGLTHGLITGANFAAVLGVLPLVALSVCGQLLYGTCLTATLQRGDLSAYYPIIRASPVFIVIASVLLLGKSYPLVVLLGIAMAAAGAFFLLYRRGSHMLDDRRTLALAVTAMSGSGIYSLADARMMQTLDPQVMMFAVEGLIAPVYAVLWLWRRRAALARARATAVYTAGASHGGPRLRLLYLLLPGLIAYASYYLILLAYQLGGEVAAVTSLRQASIPISVALGGLFLREGAMARRFFAALLLALGIVVIAVHG